MHRKNRCVHFFPIVIYNTVNEGKRPISLLKE
jgi:hypothetical protein